MLYRTCRCGKHKIWFWERIPFVARWLAKYRQRKMENKLATSLAEEIRKEIDKEIIDQIMALALKEDSGYTVDQPK